MSPGAKEWIITIVGALIVTAWMILYMLVNMEILPADDLLPTQVPEDGIAAYQTRGLLRP